ncbi:MAG TPA: hypothetical protein VGX00_04595 [Thermoplasmata archaeon]|nr:hypothetical protein [Thermoplasmata archaeon]
MLRAVRPSDGPEVARLLAASIVRASDSDGWAPAQLERTIARLGRWDARAAMRVASGLGRPGPRSIVAEVDGRVRGVLVWTPGRQCAWVAALAVGPAGPDGDVAGGLLQLAHRQARKAGLAALLVPDACTEGGPEGPARWSGWGFAPVGEHERWRCELRASPGPPAAPGDGSVRPFRRRDTLRLIPAARAGRPAALEAFEPVVPSDLSVSPVVARALGSSTRAWVHEGPRGPDAFVRATVSRATPEAHLAVIRDQAGSETGANRLLTVALAWCRERGARTAVAGAVSGTPAASLMAAAGFDLARRWTTWVRPVDGAG